MAEIKTGLFGIQLLISQPNLNLAVVGALQ